MPSSVANFACILRSICVYVYSGNSGGGEFQLRLSILRGCVHHKSSPAEAQTVESFREGQHGEEDSSDHGASGWAES